MGRAKPVSRLPESRPPPHLRNVSTIRPQTWVSPPSFPPNLGRWLKKEPGCVRAVPWWAGRARVWGTLLGYTCLLSTWKRPLAGLLCGSPPGPRGERKSLSSGGTFTGTA